MNRSARLLKPVDFLIHKRTPPPSSSRHLAAVLPPSPSIGRDRWSPPRGLASAFSSRLTQSPERRRRSQLLWAMVASGESSPESAASAADGFVHVSGHEIAPAEVSGQDPNPEGGLTEGDCRGELTCSAVEDFDDAHAEESGGCVDGGEGETRRVLPDELAKGVMVLECESSAEGGSCEVYLVGTAHVSEKSCREVQAIINRLKPEVVFLELCPSRIAILTPQKLKVPTLNEMMEMWKKKDDNIFGIMYSYFLAKVASKLEVFPGAEFRVAFEEARNYGAKVILGDRPVQITLRRTWRKMTLWHKAKFLYYIIFQSMFLPSSEDLNKLLKDLDDSDMLTVLIQEMSKAFPTLMETLLNERDMYMSTRLFSVAREHSSVVAVVGRGHLAGIKKHWKQPVEVKHLLEVPTGHSSMYTLKFLGSLGVVTGAAIISGIYLFGKRSG